jgi:arylamine N-acetyltransferase
MITIVNIDGQKYLVDSNFGPNAPIYPVPLKDGHEFDDLDGRRGRIISDTLPRTKSKDFKYWHIQFRNSANEPWVTSYAFTEMEFLEGDYSAIERGIRANKRSWFLYKVMAFRFVLDEETKKPAGWILLWENQLRKRIHGKFQTRTVHSESERIDVLEEEFGIVLDDDEKKEILGTCGYLQPTPVAKPKQKGHGGGPVSQEKAKL